MEARLDHLLDRAARDRPDHPAVIDGDTIMTYGQLDELASAIAATLRAAATAPGDRVGLYLEKSAEAVAGIYGILRAGAAYVPLDARAPTSRVGYIAGDCGIETALVSAATLARLPDLNQAGAVIRDALVLDATRPRSPTTAIRCIGREEIDARRDDGRREEDADALAYILYTSGSTGHPKGVMLTHGNAQAFVRWAADDAKVGRDDRLSSHAPFHFDLSIFDLYAPALRMATLALVPARAAMFPATLSRWIQDQAITVWYSVPSQLSMLVERGGLHRGTLASLRTIVFAGEVFPNRYLARLMDLVPDATFLNWYGPTETNVCTGHRVDMPPGAGDPDIPIGRPIDGVEAFVVDESGAAVGRGDVGELLVAGPTVMRGYWADPARTASRLVRHPAAGGRPTYRTGDLVSEDPDGSLRFVGRRDNQIKTRGYRVELGEIETAIRSHPGVIEAAVVAVPDPLITNRIHAQVVLAPDINSSEVARHCGSRVPDYMVPGSWQTSASLPRTTTGKIDRQRILAGAAES